MYSGASKTAQIVKYLVARLPKTQGSTQLVKLLYMADHESRRLLGKPISEMNYSYHHYGPWDEQFNSAVKELSDKNAISAEAYLFGSWFGCDYKDGNEPVDFSFSDSEKAILDYLIKTFGTMPWRTFMKNVVYETKPMKDAIMRDARHELLRMELVNNELRDGDDGIDYDALVRAENDIANGSVLTVEEAIRELGSDRRWPSCGKWQSW